MTPWQPIETAPQDGTDILLYWRPFVLAPEMVVAGWYAAEECWADRDAREVPLGRSPLQGSSANTCHRRRQTVQVPGIIIHPHKARG